MSNSELGGSYRHPSRTPPDTTQQMLVSVNVYLPTSPAVAANPHRSAFELSSRWLAQQPLRYVVRQITLAFFAKVPECTDVPADGAHWRVHCPHSQRQQAARHSHAPLRQDPSVAPSRPRTEMPLQGMPAQLPNDLERASGNGSTTSRARYITGLRAANDGSCRWPEPHIISDSNGRRPTIPGRQAAR
jgi:hypothetical protein